MTSSNTINCVVSKKLHNHRRKFNRYLSEVKECQKGSLTKKKASQMSYSYTKANQELAICDVLEEILKEAK
jgi:hypothetical protein